MPTKRLNLKDISAAKRVNIHTGSLRHIKGGNGVIVEDILL